ncbi:MAG: exodeoxyribonuclease VII small subunit [Clostridia bacterium]|nr:exodeoxyribonuclease VII small subunit [Clostridia bacterium]
MNIEKDIEKLDKLVEKLGSETLSIDASLTAFNEAIEAAKACLAGIKDSKGKLELLKNEAERIELTLENERLK